MEIKKSNIIDILATLGSLVFIPFVVFEISEKIEQHFNIPFNYSFATIWVLIFLLLIIKYREDVIKPFKSISKFAYNLRYIVRLNEVEPFKSEKRRKMLKNKKGRMKWGIILFYVLIILLILFYLRQQGII